MLLTCYHPTFQQVSPQTLWWGRDQEDLYQQNLVRLGSSWLWADRSFNYKFNSQGYRCAEWDNIDWDNSCLLIGDSWAFGIGLPARMTLAGLLNMVNLGVSGASSMSMLANTARLIQANIKPRAVVYIWPQPNRFAHYISRDQVINYGPWTPEDMLPAIAREWIVDQHQSLAATIDAIRAVRSMWTCNQYHFSWNFEVSQAGNCEHIQLVDHARDCEHPGIESNKLWADMLRNREGILC